MEVLLIFVTILAVVSSRNIPNTDYEPSEEQLELIFGSTPPSQTKPTAVDTPALVPNKSVYIEKTNRPYQKTNVVYESGTPKTVELNVQTKVNDCDKKGGSIDKTTGDGTKNMKQNPEKGTPEVHSRFVEDLGSTDDRMSLEVNNCPSDTVRFADKCVKPD